MQDKIKLSLFLVILLSVLPVAYTNANQHSKSAITNAVQKQYQSQLQNARSNKARSRIRSEINKATLLRYQRYLDHQAILKRNKLKKLKLKQDQARQKAQNRQVKPNRQAKPVKRNVQAAPKPAIKKQPPPPPPIPDKDELFEAASRGDINEISLLLGEGVNVNAANAQRETALHMAAARGHYSTVIFLINNGGNPFARTIKKWLPLHHATRFRHANIANYLMKKGLSPHYRNSEGYSSIDMARTNHDRRLLSIFGAN